jgi:hypothetical protein
MRRNNCRVFGVEKEKYAALRPGEWCSDVSKLDDSQAIIFNLLETIGTWRAYPENISFVYFG